MSERWPGSLISPTAPTPTGGGAGDTAYGVWTLEQADPYIAAGTWPGLGTPDPQFQYVTALLHGDGTNAAQNNTFLDSSSNNFTITRNGNTTQGSFSPYGSLWSNYFNGSNDYLSLSSNAAFAPGTSDFTIEAWLYPTSSMGSNYVGVFVVNATNGLFFGNLTTGFGLRATNTGDIIYAPTLAANQWTHVAISRSGTSIKMFYNGQQVASTTDSTNYAQGAATIAKDTGPDYFPGYISNFRLVKGTAVYTAPFTPITTPLTAITNTSLLTCQSNRFIDNSSNAFALTVNGSPSVQRFSPFQSLATYQTAKIGGSGYFDGSGDYLTSVTNAAFNFGSGAFTIEAFYYTASTGNQVIVSAWNGSGSGNDSTSSFEIIYYAGTLYCQVAVGTAATTLTTTTWPLNQWNHVVLVANGSTMSAYLNGTRFATTSFSSSVNNSAYAPQIGTRSPGSSFPFTGYISNVRIVKGTAVYDPTISTLTVPTSPLTSVSGTSLLCSMTNGAIYDNAEMNDFETVGSAQISTSVVKYGTGSMNFNGSTDYLQAPPSNVYNLGGGNFTIEFWMYPNNVSTNEMWVVAQANYGSNTGWSVFLNNNTLKFRLGNTGGTIQSSALLQASTWQHIALSRVGTTLNMYLNGNLFGSGTVNNFTDASLAFMIGGITTSTGWNNNLYFNGYIDDLRITKGYARYWFNFPPPSAPYPNYGGTLQLTYDPYFYNTTLLLNGEGTNGAQNNTFLDSSTNNFTITRNGNTTQGSFSPYGSLWSNYLGGSSWLAVSSGSISSSANFTIEFWLYPAAPFLSTTGGVFALSDGRFGIVTTSSTGNIYMLGIGADINTGVKFTLNAWNHIAISRNSGTLRLFLNGSQIGTQSNTDTLSGNWRIASDQSNEIFQNCYMSNVRVINGTGLYTSNFTPSTTPLTAVSGTQLLTCQSNNFKDNSSNNYSITLNGTPQVQRFSPFNPTSTYSTSVIGGSGYFNGSSDYLTSPSNAAYTLGSSGDFTVDGWFYMLSDGGGIYPIMTTYSDWNTGYANRFYVGFSGNVFRWYDSAGSTAISTSSYNLNAWNYFNFTRSGSTITGYFNGVSIGTQTSNQAYTTDDVLRIGGGMGSGNYFNGYISNVRIIKGATVSGSTVPTAPSTAVSGTTFLENFTNAGIPDLAMQNNLETVGNAQVSTAQYKYGSSSLSFDGTGDYLVSNPSSTNLYAFGSGQFTIEFWTYFNTVSGDGIIYDCRNAVDSTQPVIYRNAAVIQYYTNSANRITSGTLAINTWYHVAVCRIGTTTTMYINGNSVGTYSDSTVYTCGAQRPIIGAAGITGFVGTVGFNGYIDDLRVTNGLARYVQNFTPPTAALPTY